MPKIQVVVSLFDGKIAYIGYDRQKAREVWLKLDIAASHDWFETDEDTEIDLDLGKEEEDE